MAIKVCSNGHVTGYRRCVRCGTDKVAPIAGAGRVEMPRWQLRKIRREMAKRGR